MRREYIPQRKDDSSLQQEQQQPRVCGAKYDLTGEIYFPIIRKPHGENLSSSIKKQSEVVITGGGGALFSGTVTCCHQTSYWLMAFGGKQGGGGINSAGDWLSIETPITY